jgi:hypothetical protein
LVASGKTATAFVRAQEHASNRASPLDSSSELQTCLPIGAPRRQGTGYARSLLPWGRVYIVGLFPFASSVCNRILYAEELSDIAVDDLTGFIRPDIQPTRSRRSQFVKE